jgi:hypothetical protein
MTRAGSAHAVVVFETGSGAIGITTRLVARVVRSAGGSRLRFAGQVRFTPESEEHLRAVILPLLDEVLLALEVNAPVLELSLVDESASADAGLEVSGHSADVPVLLALMSASLDLPVGTGLISCGHIPSATGDVVPVRYLAAKVKASLDDGGINTFVFPAFESAQALETLRPKEREEAQAAVRRARGRLRLIPVADVAGLVEAAFGPLAIVRSSLTKGYYEGKPTFMGQNPVGQATFYLTRDNERRYWQALERALRHADVDTVHGLVGDRLDYIEHTGHYEPGFGRCLRSLLKAIPPLRKRTDGLYPLANPARAEAVRQLASPAEGDDALLLIDTIRGPDSSALSVVGISEHTGDEILDFLLRELHPESIETRVIRPIQEARASFLLDSVVVADVVEFRQIVTAFVAHVTNCCAGIHLTAVEDYLEPDAMQLLGAALGDEPNAFERALEEGIHAPQGGMSWVLDKMAWHVAERARAAYSIKVLNETIDPLDESTQCRTMAALVDRVRDRLPPALASLPPDQWGEKYEILVTAYVREMANLSGKIRSV